MLSIIADFFGLNIPGGAWVNLLDLILSSVCFVVFWFFAAKLTFKTLSFVFDTLTQLFTTFSEIILGLKNAFLTYIMDVYYSTHFGKNSHSRKIDIAKEEMRKKDDEIEVLNAIKDTLDDTVETLKAHVDKLLLENESLNVTNKGIELAYDKIFYMRNNLNNANAPAMHAREVASYDTRNIDHNDSYGETECTYQESKIV